MNLLLPLFLAAGALIGAPILLHFLRGKPQVNVVFPTLRFLGPAAVTETKRHRLRRWLTLILRCLVILLVCLAFSRPFWSSIALEQGHSVIVAVDNSFSMQAKGRWPSLKSWATNQLQKLGTGDQAGILLINPTPHWLVPLSDNIDQARRALASLEPGYEVTHYDAALRLAGETLLDSGSKTKTLVWMGDGQELGWKGVLFSEPLPPGVEIKLQPPLQLPGRQAAITKTRFERTSDNLILHVEIAQYLPEQDTRTLTISSGDKALNHVTITLEAGKTNAVDIPLTGIPEDQVQSFTLQLDPDDLPIDDTFYIVHEAEVGAGVYLASPAATTDNFDFLQQAINSTRLVTSSPFHAENLPDAAWPPHSLVIVRGDLPFEAPLVDRLDRYLHDGGVPWILLNGSTAQNNWLMNHHLTVKNLSGLTEEDPSHLRNWDVDHPTIAPFTESGLSPLLNLNFYRGFAIEGIDATPLATWDDNSSAIAEVSTDGMRFLLCGFDLDRQNTDWPIKASFVPFIHSVILWLNQQNPNAGDWRVGDVIPLTGEGTWENLDTKLGSPSLKVSQSVRPDRPGLYQFQSGTQKRLYAVNLQSEESDLTPWSTPDDFLALTTHANSAPAASIAPTMLSHEQSENQQRIWWWILALAVVLLLLELRLANRTSL